MSEPAGARFVPHLLLTAMIAIWGASYSAIKVALTGLPPFVLVAARFWLAALCVVPFLRAGAGADLRATRGPGLLAGAALAIGYLMQTLGMAETSASMGGFLSGLIVLLTGIGGFLFFRARYGALAVVGFALGLGGMVLLCWPGAPAAGDVADTPRGIALQIGSSTCYAIHILLLSHFGRGAPALALCLWQLVSVAVAATVAAAVHGDLAGERLGALGWSGDVVLAVAYLGAFSTALGIGVQGKVQHRIPPVHVALLFALQPLFAALFAWITLGDRMGAMQLTGGLTIVAGVVLTGLDRR